jgi:hypothetical protein
VENVIFNGVIFAWIITLPLVICVSLWSPFMKEKDSGEQYINVNKFATAELVIEHCKYVIRLIAIDQNKS